MAAINGGCQAFDMRAFWNSIPGLEFEPTNEELIISYLRRKIKNLPLHNNMIHDLNIYNYTPEQLKVKYMSKRDDSVKLYFFTLRDREYLDGNRMCREAGDGYWMNTGNDKVILSDNGTEIGFKKEFVFYRGKAPKGLNTNWVMHEYRLQDDEVNHPKHIKLDTVLCKISRVVKTQDQASIQEKKTHDRDEDNDEDSINDDDSMNDEDSMNDNNPMNEKGKHPTKKRRLVL